MRAPVRTWIATIAAGAVAATTLQVLTSPSATAATHPLTLSATSVEVGGVVKAKLADCVATSAVYRYPVLRLVVGSGSNARVADLEPGSGRTWLPLTVPGWADPAEPAVIQGGCFEDRQGPVDGVWTTTTTQVFAADPAPVDIVPAAGPVPTLTVSLSRTTAAQGQEITVSGSGCPPGGFGSAALREGSDLTLATGADVLASTRGGGVGPDGTFTAVLTLNAYDDQVVPDRIPVPEGPHVLSATCRPDPPTNDTPTQWAEPQLVTVAGANPTDSFTMAFDEPRTLALAGEGCTGGRTVDLFLDGGFGDGSPPVAEHRTVTPGADGTWRWTHAADAAFVNLEVTARCGDPATDGFAYVVRRISSQLNSSTVVSVEPQPALPGERLTAAITGSCERAATVVVRDGDRVVAGSDPFFLRTDGSPGDVVEVELDAPAAPGTYEVIGSCEAGTHRGVDLVVRDLPVDDDGSAPPPAVPVPGSAAYTG